MTLPLVLLAGLIAACCVALAALVRHSRERLHRIETLNKNLERDAAAQSEQLHAILAAVRVGTWSHDLAANRMVLQGRVVLESPSQADGFPPRTEHSLEEIVQAIHPEDRTRFQDTCAGFPPRVSAPASIWSFARFKPVRCSPAVPSAGFLRWAAFPAPSKDGRPSWAASTSTSRSARTRRSLCARASPRFESSTKLWSSACASEVHRTGGIRKRRSFRLMVEGVQDYAIFMLDTEGRAVSWNLGAERIFGYSAEEILGTEHPSEKILGKHFSIFCPEEDIRRGAPEEELRLASIEGRAEREAWRVRRDGSRFWASVVITAVHDDSGDLCGFSKITRDVTERRQVQQQLEEQRRGAEQANQAKSGFLAAMSHEIRTPMNAILGMTDLLWETELNDDQRHYVEIFRVAGANLMDLINNILDLSKIESGQLELEKAEFDLKAWSPGVVEQLCPKARRKGPRRCVGASSRQK